MPEPDALLSDTYSISITVLGNTVVSASNTQISDIPSQPYTIHSTEEQTVKVYPVAGIVGPNLGIFGSQYEFDASGSQDPDGTIISYDWEFGDGATGSGDVVTHSYESVGIYTIKLTVTDEDQQRAPTLSSGTGQTKVRGKILPGPGQLKSCRHCWGVLGFVTLSGARVSLFAIERIKGESLGLPIEPAKGNSRFASVGEPSLPIEATLGLPIMVKKQLIYY